MNATWGKWNNVQIVSGDVTDEIGRQRLQQGKDMILYAGASIISTLIERGLVDRFRLRVHPMLLGRGISIYPDNLLGTNLKLASTRVYENGVVLLDYVR